MSDNDFYQEQNWYNTGTYQPDELLSAPVQSAKKPKNKKKRNYRIAGAICVLLVLIVATSLAFGGDREGIVISDKPAQSGDGFSGGFSDDFEEFFKNYYTGVDLQRTDINIPRADLPDYAMELQTHEREEMSLKELYERCAPSVVAISGYKDGQNGYNWGTGVVLSEDGLILTNTHVIDGCDSAKVTLSDDRELDAKLVGADGISDLAVLKIEAEGLTPAEFGESGSLQVGESVAAIGNPLGETFRSTLTDGIISAIERGISYQGHSMTLLQTNTAINEGNSGGALFNMYGQVIGITNMKMMSSYSSIEGIGFAIPSSTVRNVVNAIAKDGEVKGRTSIGITVGAVPAEAAEHYELPEGLYVSDVAEGSDAEKQGIKVGDIITAVNDIPVRVTTDISAIKDELQVGDSMKFTVWRDGETMEFNVRLMDTNDVYG